MATGRIGTTPVLQVRWSKAPSAGTTSLSGLDDNSVSLVYSVGYEAVYRNGVLLSRTNDYTATDGTTVTLIDATITGDIIEVFANDLVPLTDAISKGQYNAKGALLSASAASTPGVLTVGANDTVLTADSAEATGLKWAAPAAGGKVLQVVQSSTNTQTSVSSTSFTDTNLSATITPTSATSKVLVIISQSCYARQIQGTGSGNFNFAVVQLLRGATSIKDFGYVQSFASPAITGISMHSGSTISLQYLDEPATTSATTYKTQGKNYTTSADGLIQFQFSFTGSQQGYSTMTLLEIGA
jgi:hypothetical protein